MYGVKDPHDHSDGEHTNISEREKNALEGVRELVDDLGLALECVRKFEEDNRFLVDVNAAQNEALRVSTEALKAAIREIRKWHGDEENWESYYNHDAGMAEIRGVMPLRSREAGKRGSGAKE